MIPALQLTFLCSLLSAALEHSAAGKYLALIFVAVLQVGPLTSHISCKFALFAFSSLAIVGCETGSSAAWSHEGGHGVCLREERPVTPSLVLLPPEAGSLALLCQGPFSQKGAAVEGHIYQMLYGLVDDLSALLGFCII